MSKNFQNLLSKLFREIEIDIGSTDLCIMTLEALRNAIEDLRGQDLHHFFEQLNDLTEGIEGTKPKYAIIIDSFYDVLRLACEEDVRSEKTVCKLKKKKFLKRLDKLIKEKKKDKRAVIKQSSNISLDGKTILLYNHSRTIEAALLAARRRREHFNVIVAEQDPDKTGEIIHFLYLQRIPFRVIPSYMVSHMESDIDMIFLSALTLKSTMDLVMDTGTKAIVSQFHINKIPIYAFLSTSKFSLWKAAKRMNVYKHVHRRKHHMKSLDFERIKFSHDRVELKLVNKVVTEKGIYTPKQVEKLFKSKLKEREELEKRVELLC